MADSLTGESAILICMTKKSKTLNGEALLAKVRAELRRAVLAEPPRTYLDTGSVLLNRVFGCKRGLVYGTLLELSGPESHGKSLLATVLCGIAQRDGAQVIWLDAENSVSRAWMTAHGVDMKTAVVIRPYVLERKRTAEVATAEMLCEEAERVCKTVKGKKILVVDSVSALNTEEESMAGIDAQNMRTKLALATFLSRLLRRWAGMAQTTNTLIVFINQIRTNPTAMFGNPTYTTGGSALRFYAHCRVRVRRAKGGKLMQQGKQVGLQGVVENWKNKLGRENKKAGYKIRYDGSKTEFIPFDKLEKPE